MTEYYITSQKIACTIAQNPFRLHVISTAPANIYQSILATTYVTKVSGWNPVCVRGFSQVRYRYMYVAWFLISDNYTAVFLWTLSLLLSPVFVVGSSFVSRCLHMLKLPLCLCSVCMHTCSFFLYCFHYRKTSMWQVRLGGSTSSDKVFMIRGSSFVDGSWETTDQLG